MENQKVERVNYLGSAIFIVFFFLAISAFSGESAKSEQISVKSEWVIELHSNALAAPLVHMPSYEICRSSFLKHIGVKTFDATQKLLNDNRNINRQKGVLEKVVLQIKPGTLLRFYVPLRYLPTEEPPVLS